MKRRILILAFAMLLAVSMILTGCGSNNQTASKEQAPSEKVVRVSLDGEPTDLDPQKGTDLIPIFIDGHVLEGLTRVYNGEIKKGMAESWEISEDGLTYTFHLRDAKWSDGVPVKAQDFEYAIRRLIDPKTAAGYADIMGFLIENAEKYYKGEITDINQVGVKALDDKTLQIKLASPTGYFLRLLGFHCFLPVRQDIVEKYGEAFASEPDKMVYNGPFVISEWKHEETVTLVKNKDYWDAANIKLDKVEMPIIPDSKTAINMFESGELDTASIPSDMIETYKQNGKAHFMPNGGLFWLQFNYSDKTNGNILRNANFRKAISYAIDRESLANNVVKNGALPATRYVPPIVAGNNGKYTEANPYDVLPLKADSVKAKEYFDKALAELKLTPDKFPTIKLLASDSSSARAFVEAVQDMVNKTLGIKFEIVQVPSKQRLQLVKDRDYQIVYANWFPDYDDPMTYIDIWMTGGGVNRSDYSNPKYDELVRAAKSSTDMAEREKLMFEAEKIILEDMPVIPTHWGSNAYVVSDRLVNYVRSLVGADPDLIYTDVK